MTGTPAPSMLLHCNLPRPPQRCSWRVCVLLASKHSERREGHVTWLVLGREVVYILPVSISPNLVVLTYSKGLLGVVLFCVFRKSKWNWTPSSTETRFHGLSYVTVYLFHFSFLTKNIPFSKGHIPKSPPTTVSSSKSRWHTVFSLGSDMAPCGVNKST